MMDEVMQLTVHEALSGIFGAISLASWTFLLVPQLYENYCNQSGDGVSILFLFIWALGDVFNLVGAIWADLVPTVIALAFYFCVSDSILILQCFYYRYWVKNGKAITDLDPSESTAQSQRAGAGPAVADDEDEEQPLLDRQSSHRSYSSVGLPGSHKRRRSTGGTLESMTRHAKLPEPQESAVHASVLNTGCVIAVCAGGALAWLICYKLSWWTPVPDPSSSKEEVDDTPLGAEILGYLSAILYLGARIPQILKNYREKSCEGLSLLFFILSLLGNLTYGASILTHSLESQYVLTNVPWLLGSLGTMAEDVIIFAQFRIYRT